MICSGLAYRIAVALLCDIGLTGRVAGWEGGLGGLGDRWVTSMRRATQNISPNMRKEELSLSVDTNLLAHMTGRRERGEVCFPLKGSNFPLRQKNLIKPGIRAREKRRGKSLLRARNANRD